MIIYDENGTKIKDPDLSKGRIEVESKRVIHEYIVDVEEQGHWNTIVEYLETGGKDVEWVIDVEEVGHWNTIDALTQDLIEDFDGIISDDWPKEQKINSIWQYGVYYEYTDEELEEIEKQNQEIEASRNMPDRLSFVESQITNMQLALVDMYEKGM